MQNNLEESKTVLEESETVLEESETVSEESKKDLEKKKRDLEIKRVLLAGIIDHELRKPTKKVDVDLIFECLQWARDLGIVDPPLPEEELKRRCDKLLKNLDEIDKKNKIKKAKRKRIVKWVLISAGIVLILAGVIVALCLLL